MKGGNAANVIPSREKLILDIRYTEQKFIEQLVAKIGELIEGKGRVEYLSRSVPMLSDDLLGTEVECLEDVVRDLARKTAKRRWTSYGSDARYFSTQGMPVIEFGPRGGNYHAEDEYVDIESLLRYYRILFDYCKLI